MRRALFTALFTATSILAQPKPPPDLAITPVERAAIVAGVAQKVELEYVDEKKGRELAAALRSASFEGIESALKLVPAVNRVFASAHDLHLRFGYDHELERPHDHAAELRELARSGYGVGGVQRLDGNIGLLTWTGFDEPAYAGAAVTAAMELLQDTDAMIIDLRDSAGGDPAMVVYLLTYFMPEGDPVHVVSIYNRPSNFTRQMWTLPYVAGRRYTGKPVYILTSARTFSAAEGFAEHMRRLRGAVLVGEKTRGGAHLGEWTRVHPHFAVYVPVGRAFDPATNRNWEGVGLEPDVAVAEAEALRTAHERALKAVVP